jgi:hypothetical protein
MVVKTQRRIPKMNKAFILKAVFLLSLLLSKFYSKAQNLEANPIKRDSSVVQLTKPRALYLELGGPGLALTVNYDTRFGLRSDKWGFKIGAGYYNTGANSILSVPFQVNYLYGKHNSFLEMGLGTTFLYTKGSDRGDTFYFDNITGFILTGTLGYRYQQQNGGINFRLEFTPLWYDEGITAGGGISIGYTF